MRNHFRNARKLLPILKIPARQHHITGDILRHTTTFGTDFLRNRNLYKGLAFTREERFNHGIYGMQPAAVKTMEEQLEVCKRSLSRLPDKLDKYIYLSGLHRCNEKLFFRLLTENLYELLPIVYTPTVAKAVLNFGTIYRELRALYLNIHDKGHLYDIMKNWPEPDVRATVVTDGQRCLGLGDQGVNSVCIAVGKMGLYTALGCIKPHVCLPVVLDAGTNNKDHLEDPFYVGLRQPRVTGQEYDEFVEEFMLAITKRFGQKMLIQFEDFANMNAFKYLRKYRKRYCVFNDDIEGTAAVAVAGFISSKRILNKQLKDHKYMFLGAGAAAVGIADLLCKMMVGLEGIGMDEARSKIVMFDKRGLVVKSRTEGIRAWHARYAVDHAPQKDFLAAVKKFKPSCLIGVSTVGKTFTPEVLTAMASFNERPLIFALSNPNEKAECTPKDAYKYTEGRAIYASGSPFGSITYKGQTFHPGQANNAYCYPGLALGAIVSGIHHITDEVMFAAVNSLCECTTDEDLKVGRLYPPLSGIQEISVNIATKMLEYSLSKGICRVFPAPKDPKAYVKSQCYSYEYTSTLSPRWKYPKPPPFPLKPMEIHHMRR